MTNIMKKSYIIPATKVEYAVAEQMLAASITNVGGDTEIKLGTGDVPGTADVKESIFEENAFDTEW